MSNNSFFKRKFVSSAGREVMFLPCDCERDRCAKDHEKFGIFIRGGGRVIMNRDDAKWILQNLKEFLEENP